MRALHSFQPSVGLASAGIFLAAAIWGLFWLPIRFFEDAGIDGAWTILLMNLPAALVWIAVFLWTFQAQKHHLVPAAMIGVFTGLALSFYSLGIVHGSVIRVTLLFYLTPIWATFIGLYWLGERSSWQRWAAIALGLVGLLCLVAGNDGVPFNIGDVLGLVSGLCWAIGASLIKKFDGIPLAGMTMFQFTVLCIVAMLAGYALGPVDTPAMADLAPVIPLFLAISLLLVLPAVLLIFWASQFLFPGRVGLLMMSEVMVAVISASILLPDERLGALQWVGAVLIIGASVVELLPDRRVGRTTS